uniref:Purple acid phosphatase N-terminal domain-containing protein n=1 Tax=Globodera rostochiensis TaxID=31243 RepID=A0A914HVE4_GLORO
MLIYYISIRFSVLFFGVSLLFPHYAEFDETSKGRSNEKTESKCSFKLGKHSRETPQQVHLSLTNNMDEMNISWLTFENVRTFVEFRQEDLKKSKKTKFAEMVKHEFRDFLEDASNCNSIRYFHTVTLTQLNDDTTYGR